MTHHMKRLLIVTAAFLAAVAVLLRLTLPPAHLVLAPGWSDRAIPGILHVHTVRSDGRGTPEEVAAAAAHAGLRFVVLTDHGDATRTPDPPTYRSGVLCLDGVEISTRGGHYVAVGLPAAPYPLGGDARDVVEDVRRLGGFGVAAHPDSPKPELQWREWDAPFDAIEVLNPDTSWRRRIAMPGVRPKLRVLASSLDYLIRPAETLTSLLVPMSDDDLTSWDARMHGRRVVALAGADAHAKIAPRNADPGNNKWSLPLPGYEASFRMMSVHVRTDAALTGNAPADAVVIVRALRAGHLYIAIDGAATPPAFEFTATNQQGSVHEGDGLGAGGPLTLHVRSDAPPEFTTTLIGPNGFRSSGHHEADVTVQAPGDPGSYWAEIVATGRPSPVRWILGNPIYVRSEEAQEKTSTTSTAATSPDITPAPIFDGTTTNGWGAEHDPSSVAGLSIDGPALRLQYTLAGPAANQFAALSHDTPGGLAQFNRLMFTARADRPMRISVQMRTTEEERWEQSAYLDTFDRERTIVFDDMRPLTPGAPAHPVLTRVRSLILVVDTVNTKPGGSGRVWIRSASLGADRKN